MILKQKKRRHDLVPSLDKYASGLVTSAALFATAYGVTCASTYGSSNERAFSGMAGLVANDGTTYGTDTCANGGVLMGWANAWATAR